MSNVSSRSGRRRLTVAGMVTAMVGATAALGVGPPVDAEAAADAVIYAAGDAEAATDPVVYAAADVEAAADPVVYAAGDIACPTHEPDYNGGAGTATRCRQKYTSDMILGGDYVFTLGDNQYWAGSLDQFQKVYDATWGRKKSVTFPSPGDHEYHSGDPSGYYTYFGVPPYYSFDIGAWHWVSLNSEIAHDATSAQSEWLRRDLAATHQPCIGAFWSVPSFSSGKGNNPSYRAFWDALYGVRADLVLGGDSHHYERFTKMAPDGAPAGDGIRQFVVGTGGRSLDGFSDIKPTSEAHASVFGVLQLRLGSGDYSWNFLTESGGPFSDSGTAACN